jgi:hypothetical protein
MNPRTRVAALLLLIMAPVIAAQDQTADQQRIEDVVEGVGFYTDTHQWASLEALFTPEIAFDYTSFMGGQPMVMTPAQLSGSWQAVMPGFDSTQHLITNILVQVRGNEAYATAHEQATHRLGAQTWVAAGVFEYSLTRTPAGWRIQSITYHLGYEEGDRNLIGQAQARLAGAGQPSQP